MDVDEPNVAVAINETSSVMVESSERVMEGASSSTLSSIEVIKDQDVVEVATIFNCEKCSSSVDYFLGECASKSSQAEKYKRLYCAVKKKMIKYKKKYETADFEHEECRAVLDSLACTMEDDTSLTETYDSISSTKATDDLEEKIKILRGFNKTLMSTVDEQKKRIKEILAENEAYKSQSTSQTK